MRSWGFNKKLWELYHVLVVSTCSCSSTWKRIRKECLSSTLLFAIDLSSSIISFQLFRCLFRNHHLVWTVLYNMRNRCLPKIIIRTCERVCLPVLVPIIIFNSKRSTSSVLHGVVLIALDSNTLNMPEQRIRSF